MTGRCWPSEPGIRFSNKSLDRRRTGCRLPRPAKGPQPRRQRATIHPEEIMQPHRNRPNDRVIQSSGRIRGYAGRRPAAGDSAVVDVGAPVRLEARGELLASNSSKRYDRIAVVVGRKSGPRSHHLPISVVHSGVGQAIHRTAAGCVPLLKRAGDFFLNRTHRRDLTQADDADLTAYILRSFESERRAGRRVLAAALVIGGGWASLVPLSGAVVIPGTVVAESNIKKIQHPTGGIIANIAATDGMRVKEGDILAKLDDTQVRASYQVVTTQLEEARARISRLTAERDGRDEQPLVRHAALTNPGTGNEQLLTEENSLFKARADARKSQRQLLRSRIDQLNEQIGGLEAQMKSKQTQFVLIGQELEGVQTLYEKHLTPLTRLT